MKAEAREIVAKALESGKYEKRKYAFGCINTKCGCVMGVAMDALGYRYSTDRTYNFEREQQIPASGNYVQGPWMNDLPAPLQTAIKANFSMAGLNDNTNLTLPELAQVFRKAVFVSL